MSRNSINRRSFVKGSASAIALMSLPVPGFSAQPTTIRLEWQKYKTTTQYTSFLNVIRMMQAVTDATLPTSWKYWVNVHVNYCPHNIAYFLAWHRGYLYYFEQQMRTMLNDSTFSIPYWDYYTYPTLPSEFTDPTTGNVLYVPRVNTNVYGALSLAPFAANVINFQRGATNAFEPQFEAAPHNPIHNIIGGYMADMQSPTDPIFYLHHANVDRLWHAWASQPQTTLPAPNNSYWSGSFTYATGLKIQKSKTYMPSLLGYDYSNDNIPTSLPPQAQENRIIRVQAQISPILRRPPRGNFTNTPARTIASNKKSLGGVANVVLSETSISASVPLQSASAALLRDAVSASVALDSQTANGTSATSAQAAATTFRSVQIVLDGVAITALGRKGGYFYNIYLNLPAAGDVDADRQSHFLGTVGPFEVSGASHHGATLSYPATEVLRTIGAAVLSEAVVSFVRVNGTGYPKGEVLKVGEMRLEVSTDAQ